MKNAIHNNTTKQHLEIAAIWHHCLSSSKLLLMTDKHST